MTVLWWDQLHQKAEISKAWWHHDMETLSTLVALYEGNQLATGEFPSQKVSNV